MIVVIIGIPEVKAEAPYLQQKEYPELGVTVQTIAENLEIPWSIDWLPDGTILFTERGGELWAIKNGTIVSKPLISIQGSSAEGGMLGVAVDPNFDENNNYIYIYYTYSESFFSGINNKVVRYHITEDTTVEEDKVIIDQIPGAAVHNGGRIQFGPDQKLYVTTGDAANPDLAQNLDSLAGKILRINTDGSIPKDNPYADSPVWSMGHRNPQGMDWDKHENMVATEHGPSGERGIAHDEINVIVSGKNYGWPKIVGGEETDGMQEPILHTGYDTWAPAGAEFYQGNKIPEWTDKYFVATLRGSHLHMLEFDLENDTITDDKKLFQGEFGRIRDVQTGPDGFLYILTSNRDGRGIAASNDDRILRIIPMQDETQINVQHFEYNHQGQILRASVQYTGIYEISPIIFDLDSKNLSFDFVKVNVDGQAQKHTGTLLIERPLISPPYSIQIESADNPEDVWYYNEDDVEITKDNFYRYELDLLDKNMTSGTITVTGTYVIPEFGTTVILVLMILMMFIVIIGKKNISPLDIMQPRFRSIP